MSVHGDALIPRCQATSDFMEIIESVADAEEQNQSSLKACQTVDPSTKSHNLLIYLLCPLRTPFVGAN